MDIVALKEYIINNNEVIEELLEKAGFHHIKRRLDDEIRCAWHEDGNPTAISIRCDSLLCKSYTNNIRGDIITLIENKMSISFKESIRWIANQLGLKSEELKAKDIQLPFNGFFKGIRKENSLSASHKTLNPQILNEFSDIPNQMFILDGISTETQIKYKIGYDPFTGRITVPWYSVNNELIGVMGRLNDNVVSDAIPKWFPIIPFSKDYALYGYCENYHSVLEKGILFIGESEKFVMQLDSGNIPLGFALGGNHVSEYKANCIKSLYPSTIVTCYDEGLPLEIIIENTKKLKIKNAFFENKVGYIFDDEGKYLPIGSKASPTDFGIEVFEKLIEEKVVWI